MPIPKITAQCWLKNAIEKLEATAKNDGVMAFDPERLRLELKYVLAYVNASLIRRRKNAKSK